MQGGGIHRVGGWLTLPYTKHLLLRRLFALRTDTRLDSSSRKEPGMNRKEYLGVLGAAVMAGLVGGLNVLGFNMADRGDLTRNQPPTCRVH